MWYIHAVEYYRAMKTGELTLLPTIQMNLRIEPGVKEAGHKRALNIHLHKVQYEPNSHRMLNLEL